MTALPDRRRRATFAMLAATVLVAVLIPVLGYVGVRAVLDSTGGSDALADNLPIQVFPETPTGLYLTTGEDGGLTSASVFVLGPTGTGGTIISIPVNADVGFADAARQSLQQVFQTSGVEETKYATESLLRLALDHVTTHDADEVAGLLFGSEPVMTTLPRDAEVVVDGDEQTIDAGEVELDAELAAAILTGEAPAGGEALRRGNVEAVWAGVVDAVGSGLPAEGQDLSTPPTSFDDLSARVFAGAAQTRGLSAQALTETQNPTGIDTEQLDRSEAVFVFASIAPGEMLAPSPGLVFRIEAPSGYDPAVKRTIDALLFLGANIVSIDTTMEPRPDTVFRVPDQVNRADAELTNGIFGPIGFEEPTVRIDLVDLTVVLGTDYLESVEL